MTTDRKYVINLRNREDRRLEMEKQLRRVGWHADFFHAEQPSSAAGFPSVGARGCFLSHLAVLKQGRNERGHILMMEDDLNFVSDFARLWTQAYSALQKTSWSIFYPAHSLNGEQGIVLLNPSQEVRCAHFLMINENAVE